MDDRFLIFLDKSILENQRLYNVQANLTIRRNINATIIALRTVRNKYLESKIIPDSIMEEIESSSNAEILYKDAAEDEFGFRFAHTRNNQLVAKVSTTNYYRHTQYGYEPIPESDIRRLK